MHEVVLVCFGQGSSKLKRKVASVGDRKRAQLFDMTLQILPGDVFHHEIVKHRSVRPFTCSLTGING